MVTYEVTIKERGYRPEPYAIADALILADGKPIVAVTDMALQLSGSSQAELEQLWKGVATADDRQPAGGTEPVERAAAAEPRRCLRPRADPCFCDRQAVGRVWRGLSGL